VYKKKYQDKKEKEVTSWRIYIGIVLTALTFTTTIVAVFAKRTYDMINLSYDMSTKSSNEILRIKEDLKFVQIEVSNHDREIQKQVYEIEILFNSIKNNEIR
jgi:NAD/NADP transhydrogenase beta subunit